jgi:hypothetical protein
MVDGIKRCTEKCARCTEKCALDFRSIIENYKPERVIQKRQAAQKEEFERGLPFSPCRSPIESNNLKDYIGD